jgi:hypothetical protein
VENIKCPFVITVIAIIAIYSVVREATKPRLATEIRAAYDEINRILKDGKTDAEKTKAIQAFTQEIGSQIRAGFKAGFGDDKDKTEGKSADALFLETKQKVGVKFIKYTEPRWAGRESYLYKIKNNSDKYIGTIRVNFEYYKKGELIDCENKWISDIQILEPQHEMAIAGERNLPGKDAKTDQEQYKSDEVRIKVTSFDIKKNI